MKRQVKGQERY